MSEASSAQQEGDGALERDAPEVGGVGDPLTFELDDELEELRRLLLAPEQEDLAQVRARLRALEARGYSVEDVGSVLPEAVALRAGQDNKLARALGPTVEETLRYSIQRDPQPYADALFPIFGPAIRKSISEALSSMFEAVNRTVENSLSPQSFAWRLEAWRTGQSFSEVVLLHTLRYRVEQVLLIDEKTGLPLQHVTAEAVDAQDSSLVSSMLTALENFAQDSFEIAEEGTLGTMQVGDLTVWIEQGPRAVLAAVIRGIPAPELRNVLKDILETIHLQFKPELEAFDGDREPLAPTQSLLESALVTQYEEKKRKTSPLVWILLAVVVAALAFWIFSNVRERIRWNDYLARLQAEPGLVVTGSGHADGAWYVNGLRDPLARHPDDVLAETPFSPDDVRGQWAFYQALDSSIVVRRAAHLLELPDTTVELRYEGGTLTASGVASGAWIAAARQRARFVAGVAAYDDAALVDEAVQRFQQLADALERQALRFEGGTPRLVPGQQAALDALIAQVQRFHAAAEATDTQVRLQVLGHVSTEGDPATHRILSRQRAEAVRRALIQSGMPPDLVEAIGTGTPRYPGEELTEAEREANRSVSFNVVRVE